MSSTYPSFFNGELPNIFNPSDFYTTQYIPNLQTDSAIVTTNLLASNNNVIQVSNDDGTTSTGATQSYVDNAINNLSNTLNEFLRKKDIINKKDNFLNSVITFLKYLNPDSNPQNNNSKTDYDILITVKLNKKPIGKNITFYII